MGASGLGSLLNAVSNTVGTVTGAVATTVNNTATAVGTATGTTAVTGVVTGTVNTVTNTVNTAVATTATTLDSVVKKVAGYAHDPRTIIICMKDNNKETIAQYADSNPDIWDEPRRIQNIETLNAGLQEHARKSQGPVIELLKATNNTGKNVVVGTIDTGVLSTHETISGNWIGPYGWYDPGQKTTTPFDANGHGTHTLATIVGGKGFMMCPTDVYGNNCNAAKAPHLVSNSWGVGQGMTYFKSSLDAWSAARILPIFATGNSGANGCTSVVSPGDSTDAFAVGATDVNDALGAFSSLGPSVDGVLKPDFTAPGVAVRSAWINNNTDYASLSGTSMAAPHLSGTIALALSARPGFCFSALKQVLQGSMDRTLAASSTTCGGTSSSSYPNNLYGYGRINAQKVVNAALAY
ncbi:Subtilisin serine protease [Phytophthora megakarya]|uniref:subtilisin n=1 Tax=Phytophthora megakarya TaxID=4795 RepID=A0A225W6L9_9STRA|nr:Subtilisin serine protease [Phytophthora megakarya]